MYMSLVYVSSSQGLYERDMLESILFKTQLINRLLKFANQGVFLNGKYIVHIGEKLI